MSNKNRVGTSAEDFIDKYVRKKQQIKELVATGEYMKWLDGFTQKYSSFNDQRWLYFPEEISEEDNEKVGLLTEFFDMIDTFADSYYIYPTEDECGIYYSIEYNQKVYEVGVIVGQGAITFCNTIDVNKDAIKIPIDEILNPTYTKQRKEEIESKLEKIEKLFNELINNNVPYQAIKGQTSVVLSNIKYKK